MKYIIFLYKIKDGVKQKIPILTTQLEGSETDKLNSVCAGLKYYCSGQLSEKKFRLKSLRSMLTVSTAFKTWLDSVFKDCTDCQLGYRDFQAGVCSEVGENNFWRYEMRLK